MAPYVMSTKTPTVVMRHLWLIDAASAEEGYVISGWLFMGLKGGGGKVGAREPK